MTTILIVEDQQRIRQLLIATLTPKYRVMETTDSIQAIEMARLHPPDLILLDLILKGYRDGLQVCRTLRGEADRVLAQVPIVILTGEAGEADIKSTLAEGANSFVSKPYSPTALLSLVETLLTRGVIY